MTGRSQMEPQMRRFAAALLAFLYAGLSASSEFGGIRCGTSTVVELLREGWELAKADYIERISRDGDYIILMDGTTYEADMTSGMIAGDPALLLRKYVRTPQQQGYIHNICAGGFDAWVRPVK